MTASRVPPGPGVLADGLAPGGDARTETMNRLETILALVLCVVCVGLMTARLATHAFQASAPPGPRLVRRDAGQARRAKARARLVALIHAQGRPGRAVGPPVVVDAADFLVGNDDPNSIGANLDPHPGIERFAAVLSELAARREVQAVLVEIKTVDDADPLAWPTADTVYVLCRADREAVAHWLAELRPATVFEGYPLGKPPAAPEPLEGVKVYAAWWE